jgi:hypothetical protein
MRVAGVGTSSIQLEHKIRLQDGALAASGHSVLVAWDPVARGKRALTGGERAVLA